MNYDDDIFGDTSSDHTQILPMPGGNREDARRKIQEEYEKRPDVPIDLPTNSNSTFQNRDHSRTLIDASTNLLLLVANISNTTSARDTRLLKQQVNEEINHFVIQAQRLKIDNQTIDDAKYILCTTLDEAILNTPWGGHSDWSMNTLLSSHFQDVRGGQVFFQKMRTLGDEDPAKHHQLLKLMYYCLALGYQGQYRSSNDPIGTINKIKQWLGEKIREHSTINNRTDLSPHWKGIRNLGFSLKDFFPVWLVGAISALLLVAIFTTFLLLLNNDSTNVISKLKDINFVNDAITVEAGNVLPPPKPTEPPIVVNGLGDIKTTADKTIIDISGDALFALGKASVKDSLKPILEKLANELNTRSGRITITGYSDNVPLKSVRLKAQYGSNQGLSEARAKNVANVITPFLDDPSRITTEGKGAKNPVADNKTREGRAKNRRVEINLIH